MTGSFPLVNTWPQADDTSAAITLEKSDSWREIVTLPVGGTASFHTCQLLHRTCRHQAAEMVQKDSSHCTAGGIYGVFTGANEVKRAEMFQEMKR